MENRFKLQISKIFQSTFNSCRQNTTSDVSDHRNHRRLIDLFSPKPKPQSSPTRKPKSHLSRQENTLFPATFPANPGRRRPHSISPVHEKPSKSDRKKKPHHRRRRNNASFSSITDNYYYNWTNWWSSDEYDHRSKTTLFSRPSISSDSDESGSKIVGNATDVVVVAVAKDSNDPYEDFRVSMVDMIVEKELFGVEELENLVECFVKLNCEEHHKVIFEVFAEIWEILIGDSNNKKE